MIETDPRHLNERYRELFQAGNLEGLLALYEDNAILCPGPGQEVKGRAEIGKRLAGLLTLTGTLTMSEQSCVELEHLALLHARWRFVGTAPDGRAISLGGVSSKLARRGDDAAWRYVLDLPLGGRSPDAE